MKKLFLKMLLLISIVSIIVGLAGLAFIYLNDASSSYAAAIIDKHRRLHTADEPRIIFLGGSNLAFGLDSGMIEKAMGISPVNMGLQIGLGLNFQLSEVEPYIKKSDIVVIVPEYEQLFGTDYFYGDWSLAYCWLNFPETRKYIKSVKQYAVISRNYLYMLRTKIVSLFLQPFTKNAGLAYADYPRQSFNIYGDLEGHLKDARALSASIKLTVIKGDINRDAINAMNRFARHADKIGARVYFMFPCMLDEQFKANEKKIRFLTNVLHNDLHVPILSDAADYIYPESYFFDSVYHLNAEGRKARTDRIIAALRDYTSDNHPGYIWK